jgi:hypothetical protein
MNRRNVMTTVGGLVMLAASTVAGTTIWALLTAPASVADMLNGIDGRPLWFVVRALSEAVMGVVRHL